LPLVAGLIGVLCVLVLITGQGAALLVDEARARTAADAAALAGVTSGRDAAAALADANGGHLVGFSAGTDGTVAVEVTVGRAHATARAGAAARPVSGAG
jgi:hypothetical protein